MPASTRSKRVLLYSHDSFGLGHVSRCRTIANAIVEADQSVSVLILSGSPVVGSYEFRSGVDFVRIPGVVKIETGEYDSANLRMNVEHTLEMRTRIIRDTADIFRPDLFIVDKEPLGLRGEVGPALRLLKERGTPLVLGLRDVMDDPAQLAKEWERKNVVPALRDLYDEIWVYGLPQVNKPLTGIDVPPSVRHKMVYTGYLRRELPLHGDVPHEMEEIDGPFILVTPGILYPLASHGWVCASGLALIHAFAAGTSSSVLVTISSIRPISLAWAGLNRLPWLSTLMNAFWMPSIRTVRVTPPPPGSRPRVTSGKPTTRPFTSAAMRW